MSLDGLILDTERFGGDEYEWVGEIVATTASGRTIDFGITYQVELRSAELRAEYSQLGYTVYDHLDRWIDEHMRVCSTAGAHQPTIDRGIYIIQCPDTMAVAVCESWQFPRPKLEAVNA